MAERTLEHLLRPRTAGLGLEVFAAEDTSAQITWAELPEGRHDLRLSSRGDVATRIVALESDGGAGALVVDELSPSTRYEVRIGDSRATFTTVATPRGEELFRFATVSDLHLGRGDKTFRGPLAHVGHDGEARATAADGSHTVTGIGDVVLDHHDPVAVAGHVDHQYECAAAAVDEAIAWGAQHLVVKGDLCEESYEWIWDQVAELLADLPIPVSILPGNHDTGSLRQVEPEDAASARGLRITRGVEHVDAPGLRIVLADSTVSGNGWGSLARHAEAVGDLVRGHAGAFVATHHHAQRFSVPLFWPHGTPGPDARRFAATVRAANPSTMITSGHTHRCRRRSVAGVEWTEVAATNHFPGVWAGYVVHEGGVRQTVRRIERPDVLAWTEHTRDILRGVWALWATGTMPDRCFTLDW